MTYLAKSPPLIKATPPRRPCALAALWWSSGSSRTADLPMRLHQVASRVRASRIVRAPDNSHPGRDGTVLCPDTPPCGGSLAATNARNYPRLPRVKKYVTQNRKLVQRLLAPLNTSHKNAERSATPSSFAPTTVRLHPLSITSQRPASGPSPRSHGHLIGAQYHPMPPTSLSPRISLRAIKRLRTEDLPTRHFVFPLSPNADVLLP